MRNLFGKLCDIKEIVALVEAQYLITGNIQSKKDRLRINVEMIETSSDRQIWSKMYDRNFNEASIFDLQDEIVKLIVSELDEFCNLASRKSNQSVVAVAWFEILIEFGSIFCSYVLAKKCSLILEQAAFWLFHRVIILWNLVVAIFP